MQTLQAGQPAPSFPYPMKMGKLLTFLTIAVKKFWSTFTPKP